MKVTNARIGLGIPCGFPMVHTAVLDSLMLLESVPDVPFVYIRANNGYIDDLRNEIVEKALESNCSHLLMLDADMLYPHDTIIKLYSHKLDVVSGLIWRRYPPFDSLMYKGELNSWERIEEWKDGELVEVDATGTGCIMYNCEVFRKIKPPWFEFVENPDKERGGVIGEDIGFCLKLKKAGYRIFVDTSVKTAHLTTFSVNENAHKLFKKLYSKGMTAEGIISDESN